MIGVRKDKMEGCVSHVILYLIVNHIDSCHGCVCGPLT